MNDIKELINKQKQYFYTNKTKDLDFRIKNLKILKESIQRNEKLILNALKKDLNKSEFEGYLTEVGTSLDELNYVIKNLKSWCKPKKVKTHFIHFLSKSYIYTDPYGVALIIAPWNYPFQLAIMPLIGAIAAGNCAVIKPSEYALETSKVLLKIMKESFSEEYITVILGAAETSEKLLNENFDYIFFTGSPAIGKLVMKAAAKKLTPLTLELGGKSPCIVDKEVKIKYAAKRIVWGKYLNAGQTCVAPDYLIVHKDIKAKLLLYMTEVIKEFYGEEPLISEDLPKIINEKHFNRLLNLLDKGTIATGGQYDKNSHMIAPTIIDGVSLEDPIMQEEIFGPIFPVIEYEDLDHVISILNHNPKPLALYMFSTNKKSQKRILESVSYGGGCINDTVMHLSSPYLPFGGVGTSGLGSYHGKGSFEAFSHKKSVLKQTNLFDLPLRYPPYKNKLSLIKKILK